jgi:hypothetical protein
MALPTKQIEAELAAVRDKYAEVTDQASLRAYLKNLSTIVALQEKMQSETNRSKIKEYKEAITAYESFNPDFVKGLDADLASIVENKRLAEELNQQDFDQPELSDEVESIAGSESSDEEQAQSLDSDQPESPDEYVTIDEFDSTAEPQNQSQNSGQGEPEPERKPEPEISKPHVNRFLYREYTGTVDGRERAIPLKDDSGKLKRYQATLNEINKSIEHSGKETNPKTVESRLKEQQMKLVQLRSNVNIALKVRGHSYQGDANFRQFLSVVDQKLENVDKSIKALQQKPPTPSPRSPGR